MSIISDALKKAQNLRNKAQEGSEPASHSASPHSAFRMAPIALVAAILVISAGIYTLFKKPLAPKPKPAPQETLAPSHQEIIYMTPEQPMPDRGPAAPPTQQTEVPAAVEAGSNASETRPLPSLVLNGIMYSTAARYAIINNGMVLEGDVVNGAKVERIERNQVLIRFDSREITLRLKK